MSEQETKKADTSPTTATDDAAASESAAAEQTPSSEQAPATEQVAGATESGADAPQPAEHDNAELDPNTGWLPLESNPAVVNPFAHAMGLPKEWNFVDVYGLEQWAFDMIPKPVAAVVLLFPSSQAARDHKLAQHAKIVENGQTVDPELFYTTQVDGIGNACGTIACMHCLLNGGAFFKLSDSALTKFAKSVASLNPLERGRALLQAQGLRKLSDDTASTEAASTECPEAHVATNAHFIAFVEKGGILFELDGRKAFPINHGATTQATFLADAGEVIKRDFMNVNPNETRFNVMALAKTE